MRSRPAAEIRVADSVAVDMADPSGGISLTNSELIQMVNGLLV